ncbi:phosphoribosylformylglycinamidine synthase [Sporobacter termitidis DSM 10068]|uniref:Phosphoribosylformylglycinamidine synthase n=1 Tax=Sporobacter termitidis DSM 10068 TaxID=1123282 RepID=A0A1M5YMF9_9FIRM|nr:phosphoribosylformylglycinamidine synthase [Sporobacter termitidis]SHI13098.1 phosphoribosylformylglycinamidine synthase [Sporobacter termitidis DSM 10068]
MQVFRCYTEKRPGFDIEAQGLLHDLREFLGLKELLSVRIFNRYDTEGITPEIYGQARATVFSEPQVDDLFDETMPEFDGTHWILGVEALPGQFDQRADSCAQCIQILTCLDRPSVNTAKFYVFFGALRETDRDRLRAYLINPVETREASPEKPETLAREYPAPAPVATVGGFTLAGESALRGILDTFGLAMDIDDLRFMQAHFRDVEKRDPTLTELRLVDTYWSDHCRHTTFLTQLDKIEIEDEAVRAAYGRYLEARDEVYGDQAGSRPKTLMDLATIGAKVLKKRGLLKNIDISEEINACSIHVDADINGAVEDWLLMFKNETHNHPTEIEPYGGAATCIGGAIRDPLSGRAYVYQAMRVTGAGDPRLPQEMTLPGKLPQRKLTVTAAQGYSSYGNQIGLATGLVHEVYNQGYIAKRMEIGAVVGAVRAENVVRLTPVPGDKVILLGGRTGRDGIGGATGSSKTHNDASLVTMASEVQKGNAPEERKIQRLFLDPDVTKMIKRCNDFGAGGVSVAIGELADGLDIDLTLVRKKYEGLDATEIAISESQERMAVVVAPENADTFVKKAAAENLEAYVVAEVTADARMVMRHNGAVVADLSRAFLSSNGAEKHADAKVGQMAANTIARSSGTFSGRLRSLAADLRFCSQRGLMERFDSSIGAGSVLMPYGGKTQKSPVQVMAALLPVMDGATTTCSVMSFGFDSYQAGINPYEAAKTAVVSSVSKLVAAGCDPDAVYLTFQEYFERLRRDAARWGKPLSALLGALDAQLGLELAAIGGKDSMSGSFNDLDVPPSLVSFAVAPNDARYVISPEFKASGNSVVLFETGKTLPETKRVWQRVRALVQEGVVISAWSVTEGGIAEGLFKMAFGNRLGFKADETVGQDALFAAPVSAIIAEVTRPVPETRLLGKVTEAYEISAGGEAAFAGSIQEVWEGALESVFPTAAGSSEPVKAVSFTARPAARTSERFAKPRAVITAFPGTNCENDTARAVRNAGGCPEIQIVRNLTPALLASSVEAVEKAIRQSQIVIIPGGFSGGDEPDGSAKFITAFFRNPRITDAVHDLLHRRGGLMLGICNGFQALIKLGLVPYGEIRPTDDKSPTLTFNLIGRHQAKYVYTRIASVNSPWMSLCNTGDVHALPVSHGEGRFVAPGDLLEGLVKNGQLATQYCDAGGVPSQDIAVNPNGSLMAVEGILSPDGRVFGKMCHTERRGNYVAKNISGEKHQPIFESGVKYFI